MTTIETLADRVRKLGLTVAVAESLTCGKLASELGKGENASEWLAGGVVAYTSRTKFDVLGVDEGPVVTERAARQMAQGVATLLKADAAVAVTGVGGPGPEEGEPAGTVYIASRVRDRDVVARHDFDGEPEEIIDRTVAAALEQLDRLLAESG